METKTNPGKNNLRNKILIAIVAIVLIVTAITFIYIYMLLSGETFYQGIEVDGIKLDNLNKEEAVSKIKEKNQPRLDKMKISLAYNGSKWEYNYNDIGAQINTEEVINEAYSIGRKGNIIERLKEIYKTSKNTKEIGTKLSYDLSLINDDIKEISEEIYEEPADATIQFQPGKADIFTFTSEKAGRKMLLEKTIKEIKEKVALNDFSVYEITTEQVQPKYTLDEVKTWTSRIAYYSTPLTNQANRNHNIRLSSKAYNNIRIEPGEEYSMNEATGPRGSKEGYKSASVIKQGKKFEAEPGGGNCQTSTTLYGAVMRADLDVLNRLPHSIKSNYTDIGTDAMVDYPWADFKFKNNKDTPIFIRRYISGGRLHVEIYGKAPKEYDEIKIISEKISESDMPAYNIVKDGNLLEGKEEIDWYSRPELKAISYRVYYKDGKEIKRVKESHSTYPGVTGQKRVGTKERQNESQKENLVEGIEVEENQVED